MKDNNISQAFIPPNSSTETTPSKIDTQRSPRDTTQIDSPRSLIIKYDNEASHVDGNHETSPYSTGANSLDPKQIREQFSVTVSQPSRDLADINYYKNASNSNTIKPLSSGRKMSPKNKSAPTFRATLSKQSTLSSVPESQLSEIDANDRRSNKRHDLLELAASPSPKAGKGNTLIFLIIRMATN